MTVGEMLPVVVYACAHHGVPLTNARGVATVARRVLKAAGVPAQYISDIVALVANIPATTVARAADHVICPACGGENDMWCADSGNYDAQGEEFDCSACGTRLHIETVLLLVAGTSEGASSARAAMIRGDASTSAAVRALMETP